MKLPMPSGTCSLRIVAWGLLLWLAVACAQQASPQGGPRDEVPPTIEKTSPSTGALRFKDDDITIYFSEVIRKPTFDKEVFISPLVKRPELRLSDSGKRLTIKFEESLRPQTTYIITLNDIQDANEGNKLAESYVLAFSTGDRLDSAKLRGRIFLPELGKGAPDMSVLLFDPDSAIGQDFLLKRPAYLTKTNQQGEFTFRYLRDAPYRILGVKDEDQSNSYSLPSEQVAIVLDTLVVPKEKVLAPLPTPTDSLPLDTVASDSLLDADSVLTVVEDSLPTDSGELLPAQDETLLKLLAFVPDTLAPTLRGYDFYAPRTLALRLTEFPRLDTLEAWLTDTTGGDSARPLAITPYRTEEEIILLLGLDRAAPLDLHLRALTDSLYNGIDTVLRVEPESLEELEQPVLQAPALRTDKQAWQLLLPRLLTGEEVKSWIQVSDTARFDSLRQEVEFTHEREGFYLFIRPQKVPDPALPYLLSLRGEIGLRDSAQLDSVFRYQLEWIDPESYGTLSGRVQIDSSYEGGLILELRNSAQEIVRTGYDTTFRFTHLKEGEYSFRAILDEDGNRCYSPGQLMPPRWPERSYQVPEKVNIRGNWDFADHVVVVPISDEAATQRQPSPAQKEGEGEGEGRANLPGQGPPGQGNNSGRPMRRP